MMTRIIYVLLGIYAVMLTSCEKDSIIENIDNNHTNAEFTFTLSLNDIHSDMQWSSDSIVTPKRWIMEVWDETGNAKVNCFGVNLDTHRSENSDGIFTVTLDTIKVYTCLFWADNGTPQVGSVVGTNGTYNADHLKAITLVDSVGTHTNNACFSHVLVGGSKCSQTIELKRAVAKVCLLEVGANNPSHDITVRYTGYNSFNVFTKSVIDSQSFSHFFEKDEFETTGSEKALGSFLAFATDSDAGISVDFTITESMTNQVKTISDVKLQSNERTNIKEHFFVDMEVIQSVNAIPQTDNVLRFDINVEFNKAVSYHIEYWKSDNKTSKKTTKSKESGGYTTETLILLEPEAHYTFKVLAYNSLDSTESATYHFTTTALPADLLCSMDMKNNKLENEPSGYMLQMRNISPNYITLFNMKGVMLWYQDMGRVVEVANFDVKTNTIVGIVGSDYFNQEIVLMDLMGKKILDKAFNDLYAHHDIRRMPDGNIVVVNMVPKTFDLTPYGGNVDDVVWGDGYTILDIHGNIQDKWDCFGELSPLDDPEIMNSKTDWLHANSINFDSEGNFYMSFNWPSELWKINKKSGNVLYRIGKNGNTHILPSGYTSGIHTLMPLESDKILLLDNGYANSITRAMIYSVEEDVRKVTVTLDVSLPAQYYTSHMGNVDIIIPNDLLMFNSSIKRAIVFTDYKGNVMRVLNLKDPHFAYRSVYIPVINY